MVTAAFVSLKFKPEARAVGRRPQARVTSIKSRDLLATPTLHWKNIISHEKKFAEFLGDFQQCVSSGAFGWQACPYPATAAIYVGLRWHHQFDPGDTHQWEITDLDALFRAFFWRNALSSRYDQGFLTQLGTDITQLKLILNKRRSFNSFEEWARKAMTLLDALMDKPVPESSGFRDLYSDRQTGALQKALLLPIATRAQKDLLSNVDINFPARSDIQLHHIYPQAWCRDNRTGQLSRWLDPETSKKDWVRSAANLIPLTRESNLEWRAANPSAILRQKDLSYASHGELFSDLFISKEAFDFLKSGADGIPRFWIARAESLASHLKELLSVANHR